jgi:hypothetical protein
MSPDLYVLSVVKRYESASGPGTPAHAAAQALEKLIKEWARKYLLGIFYTGSYAKGTGIKGGTDVDLLISLGPRTPGKLERIYRSLFAAFKTKGYSPTSRDVSVGITFSGFKMDLIPGIRQWGSENNHSLYVVEREKEVITNLDTHVSTIRDCGWTNEIRAMKIWRDLHNINIPSFYLELLVLAALRGASGNQPAANLLTVLKYLRDDFPNRRVPDPANPKNAISDVLLLHDRMAISNVASECIEHSNMKRIIW